MRATVPRLDSITSIRPGPWWLKPLWSLRQQVEVSRMLSDAIGSRQGSRVASSSHLVCCTTMAARQQVALQPALTQMLAEHLQHPAIRREMVVQRDDWLDQASVLDLKDI